MQLKWANMFLAALELQKLFLEPVETLNVTIDTSEHW